MPDRALIPLIAGVVLGFIFGLIASVQQLQTSTIVELALVSALAAGFAGAASVIGLRGRAQDKRTVGLVRGGLAGVLAALLVFGMTRFLGEGNILGGLVLLVLAAAVSYPLTRVRVRDPHAR